MTDLHLSPEEEEFFADNEDGVGVFAPYCECEIEYDEEELASNRCKACGKEIS